MNQNELEKKVTQGLIALLIKLVEEEGVPERQAADAIINMALLLWSSPSQSSRDWKGEDPATYQREGRM